jgi:TRAP-type C4-dicarboxylate transport system substrate-binding protein
MCSTRPLRSLMRLGVAGLAFFGLLYSEMTRAEEPIRLNVVGGLANVAQYTEHEEPFWRDGIARASGGRIAASIRPFDRSGIRGQELVRYLELGVVSFGNVILSFAAESEPELGAVDLPALNPDLAALRRTVDAFRPHATRLLQERLGLELLAVYVYPAQVLFCNRPFSGLDDLAGRRIRTSGVAQSEFVQALGAAPVILPFAEVTAAVSSGVVDCAVTGSLSGNEIGLSRVTTHVHAMALSWGVTLFLAHGATWAGLPGDARDLLAREISALERRIWDAAADDTARGFACNTGAASCVRGRRDGMTLVPIGARDERARARLLVEVVLPQWISRCGSDCIEVWNAHLAAVTGVDARPPEATEATPRRVSP